MYNGYKYQLNNAIQDGKLKSNITADLGSRNINFFSLAFRLPLQSQHNSNAQSANAVQLNLP
jgi:hypothetical protein